MLPQDNHIKSEFSTLKAALMSGELGFSVIPIRRVDKKPYIMWKKFQKERADEQQIEAWFKKYPNANVGIVTGSVSGIVVVDVEKSGKIDDLPETVMSRTGGGGYHLIYRYDPKKPISNHSRIRELTDIRGEGGYIIVPPSRHKSGKKYEWIIAPGEKEFAGFPYWLLKKQEKQQQFEEGVSQGKRNESATKYVGKLLAKIPSDQWGNKVWPELIEWNLKCRPPLDEGELRTVYGSICKREARKHTTEPPIDISQFKPLSLKELSETLGLTIKHDEENKIVTFLCELTAYTENAQFNISYNAPSSTGKSYIPTEVARLFPQEDVIEIGYCSPTAFFHDRGKYDKEKNQLLMDLSHKILIFLDQPHTQLLERLRPMLSHDKKEIILKITDKSQRFGMKTKNVLLRGYPAVIFCTAGLRIDEQEATRFLLLSPEVNQDKIRLGIHEKIRKEVDTGKYNEWLEENSARKLLKDRLRAIKQANIQEIKIYSEEIVGERFLQRYKMLKPRHQRDITRLIALIKALALLNLWWRERNGSTITAIAEDIDGAFNIWEKISISQELNLPPYIYNLYQEVIIPAWHKKNRHIDQTVTDAVGQFGLTRQEILQKHYAVYGRMLDNAQLRQQILPMLETAGLIFQEPDITDKRKILVYPTVPSTISQDSRNSGDGGGVTTE